MAKNIEMSVLGSDGSYEVLYPYTIPSQVEDLLNNDTKVYIGLSEDSTPDDAFRSLYLLNVLQGKIALTLTVKDSATGTPMEGIQIACSSYCDAKGNPIAGPIETNSEGKIDVFCSVSNPTLSISGYFDIEDYSQQFSYELGNSYSAEWNVTTRNFLKMTSGTNKMFSPNVNRVDVTCVGGGGSGAFVSNGSGQGGNGGFCVVQENTDFNFNIGYSLIVGSGGMAVSDYDEQNVNGKDGGQTSFLNVIANGGGGGYAYGDKISNPNRYLVNSNGNGIGAYWSDQTNPYYGRIAATVGNVMGYSSFTETVIYGGGGGGCLCYNGSEWDSEGAGYGGKGGFKTQSTTGQNGFGGGGGASGDINSWGTGKTGGSGCVAIRMHLKTAV